MAAFLGGVAGEEGGDFVVLSPTRKAECAEADEQQIDLVQWLAVDGLRGFGGRGGEVCAEAETAEAGKEADDECEDGQPDFGGDHVGGGVFEDVLRSECFEPAGIFGEELSDGFRECALCNAT